MLKTAIFILVIISNKFISQVFSPNKEKRINTYIEKAILKYHVLISACHAITDRSIYYYKPAIGCRIKLVG